MSIRGICARHAAPRRITSPGVVCLHLYQGPRAGEGEGQGRSRGDGRGLVQGPGQHHKGAGPSSSAPSSSLARLLGRPGLVRVIAATFRTNVLRTNTLRVDKPGALPVFWVISPLGNQITIGSNPQRCRASVRKAGGRRLQVTHRVGRRVSRSIASGSFLRRLRGSSSLACSHTGCRDVDPI